MGYTNLDCIMDNLKKLKEQHDDFANDEEFTWWTDDFENDLVWQIDCHPVFSDTTPCLNDVRGVKYLKEGWNDNCNECKAKWLFEEFE